MRKVTGYIGALIVVIALMGSILAGYALNINGQSTVVNEYENVTDVSGLYSHTDQKTYIDYNPASNYIGYETQPQTVENSASLHERFKSLSEGTVTVTNSTTLNSFGVTTDITSYNGIIAFSSIFYLHHDHNGGMWFNGLGTNIYTLNFSMTRNADNSHTVTIDGGTFTFTSSRMPVIHHPYDDYNFSRIWYGNSFYYPDNPQDANISVLGDQNPYKPNGEQFFITGAGWEGLRFIPSGNYNDDAFSANHTLPLIRTGEINNNINYGHFDNYQLNVSGTDYTQSPYEVFVPRTVNTTNKLGIDYTESNRVNNYIIGYRDIGGTPVTTSSRIDLQNVSTYNYATPNKSWIMDDGWIDFDEHYNPIWDWQMKAPPTYTVYKFTDLLTSLSVPANTINVTLKIPMVMAGDLYASPLLRTIWDWPDGSGLTAVSNMPYNLVMIGNNAGTYDYKVSDTQYSANGTISNNNLFRTASYDVSTGLVNIYDYNGTKVLTDSVNNIYIQYLKNPGVSGYVDSINRNTAAHVTDTYTINYRTNTPSYQTISPISVMDVDITTSTSTSIPIYMDITKGIKIDPANVSDTIWNNEYENGTVKLLFRAEDTYGTYHNEFSVSDNTISVDYTGSRFFISLNGAEQIDVGAWRSIILNIDMLNGEVFVNPVRTFNSYTNVSTDKATIFIGDTINNTPITSISWKPTANSFTFSVYATDVFLNTYGVVMVNPSLTITNYFTDLNNFYRLVLNNFSTYGDSITVNGVTGNVSGNTITFNDETITLKNLEIIYADGHVYVEDDNDSVDLGTIVNNDISLSGVWYFETDLDRGYTTTKQIYTWDWQDFILDNTQFCIFYIGMALVGLVVARRFCIMSVIDYAVFITSIIIALSTQVIA